MKLYNERYKQLEAFPYPELIEGDHPFEIEIGCGKAKFLIQRAVENPDIQFLAIDRVGKWMNIGRKRAEKREINNIKFLKADANEILEDYLPSERVHAFHVYFPDPWPKKRHHKRRMVNPQFLKTIYDRLIPGGILYMASDNFPYYEVMIEAIEEAGLPWTLREKKNDRIQTEPVVKTNYEAKYEAEGRDLYYLELVKP